MCSRNHNQGVSVGHKLRQLISNMVGRFIRLYKPGILKLKWRIPESLPKVPSDVVMLSSPGLTTTGVHRNTVSNFESGSSGDRHKLDAMCRALEAAGVEFIDENGGGPGSVFGSGPSRPRATPNRPALLIWQNEPNHITSAVLSGYGTAPGLGITAV